MKLDDAAARLEALGNPTRLKIYRALVRAGEAGMPVGKLQDRLKVAPSTLSHHIKSLVAVGPDIAGPRSNDAGLPRELFDHARARGFPRRRVLRRRSCEQGDEDRGVIFAGSQIRYF